MPDWIIVALGVIGLFYTCGIAASIISYIRAAARRTNTQADALETATALQNLQIAQLLSESTGGYRIVEDA